MTKILWMAKNPSGFCGMQLEIQENLLRKVSPVGLLH